MSTSCESGAMAQRGEIQCTEKSSCAFAGYGEINNLRCKAVVTKNVGSSLEDGTLQRKRIHACLSLCFFLGISYSLS